MTEPAPTALDLLKRAEALLSALHGSVARHDNLAANLGCAGCELRDQIRAALPSLAVPAAVPPTTTDRAALREELATVLHELHLRSDFDVTDFVDAVLAVLPDVSEDTTATRADVLREVFEELRTGQVAYDPQAMEAALHSGGASGVAVYVQTAIGEHLRRLAAETQPSEATADDAARLDKVARWVTSEPVTANTEFGNGYRECQRDIRDLLKGRFDYDPRAAAFEADPASQTNPKADSKGEVVHGCPPDGSGLTPCCGRTPFELPRTDRMSTDLGAVTCAAPAGVQTDEENNHG